MESHPEEDNHGEHEAEGDDAVLGLLGSKLDGILAGGSGLLGIHIGMLEPGTEAEIDRHREDKRDAGDRETEVVGRGKMVDIVLAEIRHTHSLDVGAGHHSLEGLESGRILQGAVQALVRKSRDIRLVDEAGLREVAVGEGCRSGGSKHSSDVDGHIEEAETGVALGAELGIVIEIARHHLEIALEETRSHGDKQQGADHQRKGKAAVGEGISGDGEKQVTYEHHGDAGHDALAESNLVGEPAAEDRHKVNCSQESGIELARSSSGKAELRLKEQEEDGQHSVVPETLAGIGKGQGIETFGLVLEHYLYSLIDIIIMCGTQR